MSQVLVPMIFHERAGRDAAAHRAEMQSNAPTATGIPAVKPVCFAHAGVRPPTARSIVCTRASGRERSCASLDQAWPETEHRGNLPISRSTSPCDRRRKTPAINLSGCSVPVSDAGTKSESSHPRMRGVENRRRGAQAMQQFAPEPFAGIDAAAFGEILRANFLRQRGDLGRLVDAGVVFPQPRQRGGIVGKFFLEHQRPAFPYPRATAYCRWCPTPMPMTWAGLKPLTDFFAVASACLMVASAPSR